MPLAKLQETLQRPFSVIIFDIDGVLAEPSQPISDTMIEHLVTIINKKVYVNLVSGRAKHITEEHRSRGIKCISELLDKIIHSPNMTIKENLKYLFGFEQNGAVIFNAYDYALSQKTIVHLGHPEMDKKIQCDIWEAVKQTNDPYFEFAEKKSHSMALWPYQKHWGEEKRSHLKKTVDQLLSDADLAEQYVCFQTDATIDITLNGVSKANAVDFYIKAGFDLSEIARVGDSTYKGGNDTPMVIYQNMGDDGGFSVEHYEDLEDTAVTSLPKAIQKSGTEATRWLLKNIRFNENQAYIFG